jgi:hypothetical protein
LISIVYFDIIIVTKGNNMQALRKIVIKVDAGFVGTELYEGWLVPYDTTNTEIDNLARNTAFMNAEMYGIEPEDDEDYGSIEYYWEDYVPEKHDKHLIYGSNKSISWNEY